MRQPAYEHVQTFFLLKTEPGDYSWDDLERDGSTVWDGVANYAALKHMREAREGDLALIYHTGRERAAVGIARIVSDAYPDPRGGDPQIVVFDVEPVERLEKPVPLSAIRDDPDFQEADLVRQPRLSAMVLTPQQWDKLLTLGREHDVPEA
ncbi:MAG TPA: EVE domain-containing protein [Thermoanaerobaculia bacterium]|nr:EVE domain-containing protein [Thermoanaerobaculia bacterium]